MRPAKVSHNSSVLFGNVFSRTKRPLLVAASLALLSGQAAQANTATWNSAVGNTWNTGANWTGATGGAGTAPTSADDVVFDNSNVTLPATISLATAASVTDTANSLTFGSANGAALGAFTLQASTTTTTDTLTLTTGNITVASQVTGTITLGNSTHGSLVLTTGASGYAVANNNTTQTLNIGAAFSGTSKNLTLNSAGGLIILSGANTATGAATVGNGSNSTVVQLANAAALSTFSGATVNAGSTVDLAGTALTSTKFTLNGVGSGSGVDAGALVNSTGSASDAGAITLGSNTTIKNSGTALALSGAITTAGFTLTVADGGSGSLTTLGTGVISGTGGVTMAGTGTLVLSGANTFTTGGLNLQSGTTQLSTSATAAGAGTVTLGSAGNTNATLDLNGASRTIVGLATLGTGSLIIGNSSTSTAATLNYSGAGASTYGGVIQNTVGSGTSTTAVSITGGGNLTLSGNNTYSGGTTILTTTGATLGIGSTNALGTGALNLSGGASYTATISAVGGAQSITTPINFGANNVSIGLNIGGASNLSDSGAFTFLTAGTGTDTLAVTGNSTTTLSGPIYLAGSSAGANNVTLASTGTSTLVLSGTISNFNGSGGTGSTVKITGAVGTTLKISGNNTYSGTTSITGGTTDAMGDNNAFGTSTLAFQNMNTLGSFQSTGAVTLANAATFVTGGNAVFGGSSNITITGGETVLGTAAGAIANNMTGGILTLGGTNFYLSNNTTAGSYGIIGTGATTITANIADSSGGTVANILAIGTSGTPTVILSGTNTYSGGTNILGGLLEVSADNNLGASPGSATANNIWFKGGGALEATSSFTLGSTRGIGLQTGAASTTGTIDVANGQTLTYGGIIANGGTGNGTLNVNGAGTTGTLILSGASTYTGSTILTAGTLEVAASTTSGLTITNGPVGVGTLNLSGGTLEDNGSAITLDNNVTMGAVNTTFATTGGGSLTFSSTGLTTPTTFALTGNGTLTVNNTTTINNAITGATFGFTKAGSGTLILGASNTYTGTTKITAGTLQLNNNLALKASTLDTSGAGTLVFGTGITTPSIGGLTSSTNLTGTNYNLVTSLTLSGAVNASYSGTIADGVTGMTLIHSGTGTQTLSGANTYTGATSITGGALSISADNNLGTAPGGVTAADLTLNGGALVTTGNFTLSSTRGISVGSSTGTINIASGTTLTYGGAIANVTAQTGILALNGPGTFAYSGAATYTGATSITASTLALSGSLTGTAITTSGTGVINETSGGSIAGGSSLTLNTPSVTQTLAGANTYTGVTSLTAGTLSLTGSISHSAITVNGGTFTESGSGIITGVSSLTQSSGSTTLSNVNDFTGGTSIASGASVQVANLNSLENSTVTINGTNGLTFASGVGYGALIGGIDNAMVGGLSGSGNENLVDASSAPVALIVGNNFNNASNTYSGVLSGANAQLAILYNTGTLTLTGANTFTGPTQVDGGTLVVGNGTSGSLNSASAISDYTTLAFDEANGSTITNALGDGGTIVGAEGSGITNTISSGITDLGGGGFTQTGTGTTVLSGANSFTGNTEVDAGLIKISGSGVIGAGFLRLVGGTIDLGGTTQSAFSLAAPSNATGATLQNGTLIINSPGQFSFSNPTATTTTVSASLTGSGNLVMQGAGTLVLSGSNSYTGGSALSVGTTILNNAAGLGAVGAAVKLTSGTLDLAVGTSTATGVNAYNMTVNGTATIDSDAGTGSTPGFTQQLGTLLLGNGSTATTLTIAKGSNVLGGSPVVAFGATTLNTQSAVGVTTTITTSTAGVTLASVTGTDIGSGNGAASTNILDFEGSQNDAITGSISNGSYGGQVKIETGITSYTGTLTLSGNNTLTAGVNSVTGTIVANGASGHSFGTGSPTGAVLDLGGTTQIAVFNRGGITENTGNSFVQNGTLLTSSGGISSNGTSGLITVSVNFDGAGSVSAAKAGNNFLLTGTNSYILGTAIGSSAASTNIGTVTVSGSGTLGSFGGPLTFAGVGTNTGTLDLDGTSQFVGGLTGGIATEDIQNSDSGTMSTLSIGNNNTAGANPVGVTIRDNNGGTGTVALTKVGTANESLFGSNTYSGPTTINGGTLTLDFSQTGAPTSNIINNVANNSTLVLGGGTLALKGQGSTFSNSQRFNGTTINAGGSSVTLTQNSDTTLTATLGAISRTSGGGGTLNFTTAPSTSGIIATAVGTSVDGTGIIGPWATVGSTAATIQYAALNGSNQIVGYGLTGGTLATATGITGSSTNYYATGALTLGNASTGNTLEYEGGTGTLALGANTLTLNGLLNGGSGALTITGSSGGLMAGSSKELIIQTASTNTTISANILDNSTSSLTYSSAISTTLTLSGTNTYAGGTNIDSGTVNFNALAALGTGVINLEGGSLQWAAGNTVDISSRKITIGPGGGTLNTNNQNVTLATSGTNGIGNGGNGSLGVTAGTGTLTVSGNLNLGTGGITLSNGTLNLSGTNTYLGVTAISSGILDAESSSALGTSTNYSDITVASGGTLQLTGTGTSGVLATTDRTITILGTGATGSTGALENVSGTNTFSGLVELLAASTISSDAGTLNLTGAFSSNTYALTLTGSGAGNISAIMDDGSGTVTKTGSGTWTLSGNNIYTGATTVSTGTLVVSGITNSEVQAVNGGTLQATSSNSLGIYPVQAAVTPGLSTIPSVTVNGSAAAATLDLPNGNTFDRAIALNGSTNGANLINSVAGTTTTLSAGNDILGFALTTTATGVSGGATINVSGTGTGAVFTPVLGLTNSSFTYSGGTGYTVAPTATVAGGGATSNATVTVTIVSGSLVITVNSAGAGYTSAPTITLTGGTTSGTAASITSTNATNFVLNSITETNPGTGYTSAPTLSLSSGTGLVTSTVVANLALTGTNNNIGGLGNLAINSIVSGSGGGFSKIGTGTVLLNGVNTYTGGTAVNNGTLSINSVDIAGNVQSLGQGTSAVTLGVASTSSGTLLYTGGTGSLGLGITAKGNGSDTIQNGGTGLLTLAGSLVKNGTTLTLNGGSSGINVTGVISGSSANSDMDVTGGTTTLSTAATYVGPTWIYGGGDLVNGVATGTGALPTGTTVNIGTAGSGGVGVGGAASAGTLDLGGNNQTIAGLNTVGTGSHTSDIVTNSGSSSPATLTVSNGGAFAGVIQDGTSSTALTVTGGTLALSGANTYSGATAVSAGTLSITGSTASTGTVLVSSGATLSGTGSTGIVTVSGNGSVNLQDSAIDSLTVAGLTTGGGTASKLLFDIQTLTGTTTVDSIIDTGNLALNSSTTVNIGNLSGTSTLANGTYTLVAVSGTLTGSLGSLSLTGSALADLTGGQTASLIQVGNSIDLKISASSLSNGSYTLTTTAGSLNVHASGGTTSLSTTFTNTGMGTQDSLNYTSLTATGTGVGSAGGTTTNGGTPVANGNTNGPGSASNTFTATTAGNVAVSNSASVSNVTASGTPVGTNNGVTINVYSGLSTWNLNGSGSWSTAGTGAYGAGANWGANQGAPGVTSGFANTDTATFDNTALAHNTNATVSLDGATPSLKAITFNTDAGSGYTIATGSGGNLSLDGNGGDATVTVTSGTHEISAPVSLTTSADVNVASGQQITFSGAITGSGGFKTITGSGTTILSSATGNGYSGGTTVSAGKIYINSGVSGTSSGTGTGAVTVNGGTLAGSGNITTSSGVTVSSGGTLASGDAQSVSSGLVDGTHLTMTNTAVTIASANLTFDLGTGNPTSSGFQTFSNPNTSTTYMNLTGTSTLTFTQGGTDSVTLVDLSNTTGNNGSLALRQGTPYLLVAAGSDADYLNLVINSGTLANPIYSLSQNDTTTDGYVLGVWTGTGFGYNAITFNQLASDGLTSLTPNSPTGVYPDPVLYLNGGDLEVVPEPGTWALMIGGLALLIFIQRRKNSMK